MSETKKIKLTKPHCHNGRMLPAGAEVELPAHVVDHIEAQNKKQKPAPAPATKPAAN